MEENKYGHVICGPEKQEIPVLDYLQMSFVDNRLVIIGQIEGGDYVLSLENPQSTGRHPHTSLRLSEESLVGISITIAAYMKAKGLDLNKLAEEASRNKEIQYSITENLDDPFIIKPKKVCPNKDENGNCPLHNLHCGYPDCEKEN